MAESSKQNPEKLFNFKITPLNKFKLAIDALCELDFNPIGFGVIEVTEDRVDFTARNVDTNDAGQLVLNSTALQDFLYTSKCKNRIMRVNFRRISQIITVAESCNVDSITIFHIEGTNRVNFNFGNNPVIVNTVMLLPMAPGFEKFPDITLSCEAIIPSEALRAMINRLERIGNQLVFVEITEKVVKVLTGENQQPWEFKFDDQVSGFRGTSPGQKHRAWFKWPHLQMLKIASHTTEAALICFLTEPKNMIMTRFTLREVGHLVFINKAIMIDPGFDLCYNKGETSNPSGESSHAIQNTITTETDCGEINHHPFNSISMGSIDENTSQNQFNPLGIGGFVTNRPGADPSGESSHAIQNTITTETEQGIALVCDTKETDCGEINRHALQSEHNHTALCSQYQFNPLGNVGFMTNRPGADFFGVNNQHAINDGQFDNMTLENEHGIASWDGNSIVGGWNNHHVLDLGHNNSQSYHANVIRQEKEITPEAVLEPLPRFVNAEEKYDDLSYNKGETSNPSGESSHAIQNTITTETEQGIALVCVTKETDCGEINRHALQSEHNHIPQSNNITLEMLQPFWSNHTKLVDAAEELGVSRSTLKRTIKELGVEKWPRKGRKQQPDAKKRKTNNTAPFESYCSQQNVVNLGSSAAHTENVQCIMGSDLHLEEPLIESHMDIQQQVQGHLEGALHTTESSGTIVVKATYKELSVRIVFSLTLPINQLIEEIGMKFQLELNKYRLLYQDEDKEWMMLTSVEDLKYASNVAESLGTKFVRLSVIDYVV